MSIDLFNAVKVYRNCEFVLTNAIYASTVALDSAISCCRFLQMGGQLRPCGVCVAERHRSIVTMASTSYLPTIPCRSPCGSATPDDWISREIGARLGFDPDEIVATDAIQSYFNCMAGGVATDEGDGTEHTLPTITQDTIDRHGVELEPPRG